MRTQNADKKLDREKKDAIKSGLEENVLSQETWINRQSQMQMGKKFFNVAKSTLKLFF